MPSVPPNQHRETAGFALLFVLAMTLTLTVLVQSVLEESSTQIEIVAGLQGHAQAQASADGTVRAAIVQLAAGRTLQPETLSGDLPGNISVTITPHVGRVDVNRAGETTLIELARSAELTQPADFVAAVLARRQSFANEGRISWRLNAHAFPSIDAVAGLVSSGERDRLSQLVSVHDTQDGDRVFEIGVSVVLSDGSSARRQAVFRTGSETLLLDWR